MVHAEWAIVTNADAHPFSQWLACPTCASDANPVLMTDADADGTLECRECETKLERITIPAFLQWVQCPACGLGSTVHLSLDRAGALRVECSQCSQRYRDGERDGDSSV